MHYDVKILSDHLPALAIHLHDHVSSTQILARELLDQRRETFKTPALIAAQQQTAGKGRGSNRWLADEGSIAVTFVLDAPVEPSPLELPLRTGLAVREALSQWIDPSTIQIKWPNDVLVDHKKIAGVLCERRHNKDLIGIGLNVNVDLASLGANDPTLAERATSMHLHPHKQSAPPDRQQVLIAIAQAMATLWQQRNWCEQLNAVHALTDHDITVITPEGPIAGQCKGIDSQGCLMLQTGERVHHLLNGTIQK